MSKFNKLTFSEILVLHIVLMQNSTLNALGPSILSIG